MISVTMFPKPFIGYYDYQTTEGRERESFTVLGIVIQHTGTDFIEAHELYYRTHYFVLRSDGRATYLGIDKLTREPNGKVGL